ncbi:virulence RhuM family protein [Pedobacter mucosus]|uniref:virulence RhuM family protein n=1 Tax=Pedobacter mucosus TaxID=2895286 RepID=UPI001EE4B967|nr:virulence RhuM family protein [Pedobacter mucosus]UKT63264.1 virulence RhuM family protein [Pedobacter mucosus]
MDNEKFIKYQYLSDGIDINLKIGFNTIWLNYQQVIDVFQINEAKFTIYLLNIFSTKELFRNTAIRIINAVEHYNLDLLFAIGYRVNALRSTEFLLTADSILKAQLLQIV